MNDIMGSIAQSLRIALMNMEFELERRQMIQSGGTRQMNLNDSAAPSHQFDGQVQRLHSVLNGGAVGLSNQLEDHTGHWHVIQSNDLPNQQETYDQQRQMVQNAVVSPTSQSIINPTHREMHPNGILRSRQQMIPSTSNNVAGSSIQYGDEIISLSSSSSTIYDSGASTASVIDLATLYESHNSLVSNNRSRSLNHVPMHESQRMVSNNRRRSSDDIGYDSGIDIDSIEIEPINQNGQVQIEYTVQELSPIQSQFLVPVPLADPPSAMRAPTPRPIPIQRMQRAAAVHNIESIVEPQQLPPPVPPRRPMNVEENRVLQMCHLYGAYNWKRSTYNTMRTHTVPSRFE